MTDLGKCHATLYAGSSFHSYQCDNNAKVERDGIPYCGIHDPLRLEKKRKERNKKFTKLRQKTEAMWERRRLMAKYFEGISTEKIEAMIKAREK